MSNSTIPQGAVWFNADEAYDRIIKEVGKTPAKGRDHLVSDLLNAYSQLLRFRVLDSNQKARERKELFGVIVKDAINLKNRLLALEEYAARALFPFPDMPRGVAFLGELSRIAVEAKVLERQNSGAWERLERPLLEWFAAEVLPKVYEENFGKKVGASNSGPGVKFISAVMREMGLRIISTETLARALKDVRKGRPRRIKTRPSILPRPQGW
jgi:hypothetical protein